MLVPLYNISLTNTTKWRQNGITILTDDFNFQDTMDIDDNDTIFICRHIKGQVEEWQNNFTSRRIVAGGNGNGSETNQLSMPLDMIIYKKNHSIIICDGGNRRIVQWSLQNTTSGHVIISNIDCYGLAIDDRDDLYVSDHLKHEVRRWNMKTYENIVVAGGNGPGEDSTRLLQPTFLFITKDYSLYVADTQNSRIMKWIFNAKQGILIAGGYGQGDLLIQLYRPKTMIVDHSDNLYATDPSYNRIMRWNNGATEGSIVVGGNQNGNQSNQVNQPVDFVFDKYNNLYVLNTFNTRRLQKFYRASN